MSGRTRRCRAVDGRFRQPTDVAWDRAGNAYISDGYINCARRQGQQGRRLAQVLGHQGQGRRPVRHAAFDRRRTTTTTSTSATAATAASRCSTPRATSSTSSRSTSRRPRTRSRQSATCRTSPTTSPPAALRPRARPGRSASRPDQNQVMFIRRRLPGPSLQARARRQGHRARLVRQVGQAAQAVRLDAPDRVPVRERSLCRRDPELARAEADDQGRPARRSLKISKTILTLTAGSYVSPRFRLMRRDLKPIGE